MKMIEHTLTISGPDALGDHPRPDPLGVVLRKISPLVRDTVRMGFLHSSRRLGKPLAALTAAWDVRFVGLSETCDHDTQLHFEAPLLGEAAESLFKQSVFWDDGPKAEDTAFDLVGDVVLDVARHAKDSERFDTGLLRRLLAFRSILNNGLDSITIGGHRLSASTPPVIDNPLATTARELVNETPRPKRVRVQGTLDMIRVSDCAFELLLRDGARLRAVWTGEAVVSLAEQLNSLVLIEGEAVFRPSGSFLRVDTDAIAPAGDSDTFFSRVPTPDSRTLRNRAYREPQTETTGFNAIYGRWPGDESDDEMLDTLAELA